MKHLFDNITWNSLSGPHAQFTVGTDGARRFLPGFSPILAFADQERPQFGDIAEHCEQGVRYFCEGCSGSEPTGWKIEADLPMFKMVWAGAHPGADPAPGAVKLGPEHVQQSMELTTLVLPGPFSMRSFELGEYFGCLDNGRLIAMAGERFRAGNLREISGVCTHPEFQGQGFARRLMMKLVGLELDRGEVPVLHVMQSNQIAHGLYERMGFRDYRETFLRVVTKR